MIEQNFVEMNIPFIHYWENPDFIFNNKNLNPEEVIYHLDWTKEDILYAINIWKKNSKHIPQKLYDLVNNIKE